MLALNALMFPALAALLAVAEPQDRLPQSVSEIVPLRVVPDPGPCIPMTTEAKVVFFRFWDRDADGFASAIELHRGFARREGEVSPSVKFLEERDGDGDGRLSLDEVLSHPMGGC